MKFKACVNCGACCKAAPCGFGDSSEDGSCIHLRFDKDNRSTCSIASEIVKCPSSKISPAFGSGCCRTLFNKDRELIIIKFYDGVEQYLE